MKDIKTAKKRILKISIVILMLIISVLLLSNFSYAEDTEEIKYSGIGWKVLSVFNVLVGAIVFVVAVVLGTIVGNEFGTLKVETFIFNRYRLTSLNVFLGDTSDITANAYFEGITKWFAILFSVAIALQVVILIYISIQTVIKTLKQNPEKDAVVKVMLKDFLIGLGVLGGMLTFIITIIFLNNVLVDALSKGFNFNERMDGITNQVFLDIISFNYMESALSLMLYIILITMGTIFFVYYLRRFIKVAFLIIISPLVAATYSFDKSKGSAQKLISWAKMFVYTVMIQSVHALIYVALIAVVVEDTRINSTGFFASAIILISGIKFLWDAEIIVKKLFGIQAEEVADSTAFVLGFLGTMRKAGSVGKRLYDKTPKVKKFGDTESKKGSSKKKSNVDIDTKDPETSSDKKKDKEELKDSSKDKGKELTKEEKEKADKKAERQMKIAEAVDEHMPFKGLGGSIARAASDKVKSISKEKVLSASKSLLKTGARLTAAGVVGIASHATPKVGMVEGALAGYAGAGWAMEKEGERRDKQKYSGEGRRYEKNLDYNADQLIAIDDRKELLGKETEKEDTGKEVEKLEKEHPSDGTEQPEVKDVPKTSKDETEKEEVKDAETSEKDSEDKTESKMDDEILKSAEEQGSSAIENYAKEMSEKSDDEVKEAYSNARKAAVSEYQKDGATLAEAQKYADLLQKELLTKKDFDYQTLSDTDRNFLHKYLNLIAKQKIDTFEKNTSGRIKYKEVSKRANERRDNRNTNNKK